MKYFQNSLVIFLLAIIFVLSFSYDINGQAPTNDYQPMAIEGATWLYSMQDHGTIIGRFGYHLKGDSVINGLNYKIGFDLDIINSNDPDLNLTFDYDFEEPTFFLRDDSIHQKVYAIWMEEYDFDCQLAGENEFLLYDFSTEVNDTAFYCQHNDYFLLVSGIDTVEYFNYLVPRRFISNIITYEKIGQPGGLFLEHLNVNTPGGGNKLEHYCVGDLLDCIEEIGPLSSQEIIENPNFIVYPNPSQSFINVSNDTELESVTLFNMTGQSLYSTNGIQSKDLTIDIANLPPQSYVLIAKQRDSTLIRRVIIRK